MKPNKYKVYIPKRSTWTSTRPGRPTSRPSTRLSRVLVLSELLNSFLHLDALHIRVRVYELVFWIFEHWYGAGILSDIQLCMNYQWTRELLWKKYISLIASDLLFFNFLYVMCLSGHLFRLGVKVESYICYFLWNSNLFFSKSTKSST